MPIPTPNIGLQIPDFNQPNWQVQLNYDLNLLDLIFGGQVTVPALSVTTLTATNLAMGVHSEEPAGVLPGTTYVLSTTPVKMLGLYYNGLLLTPTADYTISGITITLSFTTKAGDTLWAVYS